MLSIFKFEISTVSLFPSTIISELVMPRQIALAEISRPQIEELSNQLFAAMSDLTVHVERGPGNDHDAQILKCALVLIGKFSRCNVLQPIFKWAHIWESATSRY